MRSTRTRATAAVLAAALLALTACDDNGDAEDPGATPGDDVDGNGNGDGDGDGEAITDEAFTFAFFMPDLASTRYEEQDRPLFEGRILELCPNCDVIYANADADATEQQQQVESALAQGVDVIVLNPVDTSAAATMVQAAQGQGVPIISYDRPIPDLPSDFYVSFDNEAIGASIAQSLVDRLEEEGAEGGLLQVNGSPTDAAAGLIGDGITSVVEQADFELLASFDTPGWQPPEAQQFVEGAISQFGGDSIAGVVAANDGTGGASIAAFQGAGVDPVPPVTGNDAEIAAIQRIIAGTQFNTISKPISIVAEATAEVAMQFALGEVPEPETELFDTPSQLFEPEVVTLDNIVEIIFDGGIYTVEEVCTGEFASPCEELGLT